MTDDISEAFASISVEDFLRDTSAIRTVEYEDDFATQYGDGENNWRGWTASLVASCVDDLPDNFHTFAVLHNKKSQRYYQPDGDETAYDFARRLNREALNMEATWFFSAMMVPGRTYSDGEEPPHVDADDPDSLIEALDNGVLQMGVCWFSRGYCNPTVEEAGMITYDEEKGIQNVTGGISPEHNPFHGVLEV